MIKSTLLNVKKLNNVQYMMLFNNSTTKVEVDLEFLLNKYPEKREFVLNVKLYNYLQKLVQKDMFKSELFQWMLSE
eukprot:CAMPEP_0116894168 /NCGR_PEP_ID=MMETSP0467-20121206/4007_1 /TAXON_ID=283647 /ORGANISM="Mesodinium pulex, Strain SPMC105" /LENGTH=75 /DNA_ID=CAMNT_0004564259 /DNA_START=691 /DNA_END=918 /DNA_ORIENTATION=+